MIALWRREALSLLSCLILLLVILSSFDGGVEGTSVSTVCSPGQEMVSSECVDCMEGFFSLGNDGECVECVEHQNCSQNGTSLIYAETGYYYDGDGSSNDEEDFVECIFERTRCAGNNTCAAEYTNAPECNECAENHYNVYNRGVCKPCPSTGGFITLMIIIVVCIFFVCAVLMRFARSSTNFMTSISVGLNFFQVLAVLATFRTIAWPTQFLFAFSFFNLNLDMFPLDCSANFELSFFQTWIVKLVLPFVFIPIFAIIYLTIYLVLWFKFGSVSKKDRAYIVEEESKNHAALSTHSGGRRGGPSASSFNSSAFNSIVVEGATANTDVTKAHMVLTYRKHLKWITRNAFLGMTSLLYISVTVTSMELFALCDTNNPLPTSCKETGQATTMQAVAIIGLIVYGLCVPLIIFFLLVHNRKKLHYESIVLKYGLLYRKYTRAMYLWELVTTFRKLSVVLIGVAVPSDSAKLGLLIVIHAINLIFQLGLKPYQSKRVNRLEALLMGCVITVCVCGLAFYAQTSNVTSDIVDPIRDNSIVSRVGDILIIVIVAVGIVSTVFLVLHDIRNALRMKGRGLVGGWANEDVQIMKHFFDSGFRVRSEHRSVTTTDQYRDLVLEYRPEDAKDITIECQLMGQKSLVGLFRRGGNTPEIGGVLIQHDRIAHAFHLNALFPIAGNYILHFRGGTTIPATRSGCRKIPAIKDPAHPSRALFTYALAATTSSGFFQSFVDLSECRKRDIIVVSPIEAFIQTHDTVLFKIKVPEALSVKVVQDAPNNTTTTLVDQKGDHWWTGDVHVGAPSFVMVHVVYARGSQRYLSSDGAASPSGIVEVLRYKSRDCDQKVKEELVKLANKVNGTGGKGDGGGGGGGGEGHDGAERPKRRSRLDVDLAAGGSSGPDSNDHRRASTVARPASLVLMDGTTVGGGAGVLSTAGTLPPVSEIDDDMDETQSPYSRSGPGGRPQPGGGHAGGGAGHAGGGGGGGGHAVSASHLGPAHSPATSAVVLGPGGRPLSQAPPSSQPSHGVVHGHGQSGQASAVPPPAYESDVLDSSYFSEVPTAFAVMVSAPAAARPSAVVVHEGSLEPRRPSVVPSASLDSGVEYSQATLQSVVMATPYAVPVVVNPEPEILLEVDFGDLGLGPVSGHGGGLTFEGGPLSGPGELLPPDSLSGDESENAGGTSAAVGSGGGGGGGGVGGGADPRLALGERPRLSAAGSDFDLDEIPTVSATELDWADLPPM